MKYNQVYLDSLGYELAPVVVYSSELESRIQPLYESLHIPLGQLESLTGIAERRWWQEGYSLSEGAIQAAEKALAKSKVQPNELEILIYAGVCRENFEPATACRVAYKVGVNSKAMIYDITNACLGVLNGIIDIANRIELGQIRAGMVVSCESAREINEIMIQKMLENPTMEMFKYSIATLTGGSGAIAVLLTDGSFSHSSQPKLLGGASQCAPQHHQLCRWGMESQEEKRYAPFMSTDSVSVLKYGVELGLKTWEAFLEELNWTRADVDRAICHQVGAAHQREILKMLEIPEEKDFSTHSYLGNMGTVSLPLTTALAEEREFIRPGDKVGFFGIGSGLNCLMLGWQW